MNWHSKTPDETELLLQTNVNRGLDELEAERDWRKTVKIQLAVKSGIKAL